MPEHKARGASRPVRSTQQAIHERLPGLLERHLARPWRAPLHEPTVAGFAELQRLLGQAPDGIVLDSGCGTGESTRELARRWPELTVISVDKSAARLRRGGVESSPWREGNAVWLRAELASFWRLARDAGWRLQRHFLLYPNPWPKPSQLQRRWHAHPVFPTLLELGGLLEMRCNWRVYAEEFAFAVNRVLGTQLQPVALGEEDAISPFERKYRASGHGLYSVSVSCEPGAV